MTVPTALEDVLGYGAQHAANPERLRRAETDIVRILNEQPNSHPLLLALAMGYGTFLRRAVLAQPAIVAKQVWNDIHDGPEAVLATASIQSNDANFAVNLRRRRNATHAKIALAQMLGAWTPQQVWESLSHGADLWTAAAYNHILDEIQKRYGLLLDSDGKPLGMTVLAYGKQGVRELNFSSDLDLVFVTADGGLESTGGRDGKIEAQRYFEKIATGLISLLQEVTPDGFVFRVDVRLRPNGTRGVLTPTAETFLDYHQSYSSSWERIALLRARPIAGDIALGLALLQRLENHIFPRHLDFESLNAMRQIKDKINREALRSSKNKIDLKHGAGGIRELEFLVQNLQIIFGGRHASLRVRDTLSAINRLAEADVIPSKIAQELANAYCFLRHLENTVQARDDRQVYTLPIDKDLLEVARAAGFKGADPAQDLLNELERYRHIVAREFALLYQKNNESENEVSAAVFELLENEALSTEERQALLKNNGFKDPIDALRMLERLSEGPNARVYGNRAREQFQNVLPRLLNAVVQTPAPDQALRLLQEFINRIGGRAYLYALLNENHEVIRALARLFATSLYIGKLFIRNPELLDTLVLKSYAIPHRSPENIRAYIRAALGDVGSAAADPETAADILRRSKEQEVLRIGFHDLTGDLTLFEVQEQLSSLAEVLIAEVVALAFLHLAQRGQSSSEAAQYFIPVALGKLGSRELNYGSDLDLLYIVTDQQQLPIEQAIRATQKALSLFQTRTREGVLYAIDLRLRPSGNQGLLVTTLEAFTTYHQQQAAIWERVAFVKARPLCQTAQTENIRAALFDACYNKPLTASDIEEMARIRERMVQERGRAEPLKAGKGGTADIEIATALVQLRFGKQIPALQTTTPQIALRYFDALPHGFARHAPLLKRALFSYRLLESRLHLLLDRPASAIPGDQQHQYSLAIGLGFTSPTQMLEHYANLAAQVRAAYLAIVTDLIADKP